MKEVYASLDFGSSTLKLVVAEVINEDFHILYAKKVPSHGIEKGIIVDPEAAKEDLKVLIEDANEDLKAPITKVLLNIPANQCHIYASSGSSKKLTEDKIITSNDILKALKEAAKIDKGKDEQVATYIPVKYKYDSVEAEKIPVGKKASTVIVDALIITSAKSVFYPYLRVVEGSGLEVIEVCINSYAGAKEAFDEASLFNGAVLIDIGNDTSTISFFENGFLQYIRVINSGSADLSRRIAAKWSITESKADLYKIKYGSCKVEATDQDIVAVVENEDTKMTYRKSDLAMVLIEGVEVLMGKIADKLKKVGSLEDKKIHIIGGGGELPGIEEVASRVLGVPVETYRPQKIGVRDMSYVNNLGMIYFLLDRKIIFDDMGYSVDMPDTSNTVSLRLKGLTKTQSENKIKSLVTKLTAEDDEE